VDFVGFLYSRVGCACEREQVWLFANNLDVRPKFELHVTGRAVLIAFWGEVFVFRIGNFNCYNICEPSGIKKVGH